MESGLNKNEGIRMYVSENYSVSYWLRDVVLGDIWGWENEVMRYGNGTHQLHNEHRNSHLYKYTLQRHYSSLLLQLHTYNSTAMMNNSVETHLYMDQ